MRAISGYIRMLCVQLIRQNLFFVLIFFLITLSNNAFGRQDKPVVLPGPVFSSEYFPFSKCHEQIGTGPDDRREAFHVTIRVKGHIEKDYGCYGCHDSENLDKLRFFNDRKVDIAASSELCGQCHSTIFKLWHSGLHGKVVGRWNGLKKIIPCTTCHDPHRPVYTSQKPEPPPMPPEQTLRWKR
jgi:hypothetical protein